MMDRQSTGKLRNRWLTASKTEDFFSVLYLHALNQVRDFRWRHWCFTREYILKKTAHPTATGGSPIVLVSLMVALGSSYLYFRKWLPNQLFSVYDQMVEVEHAVGTLPECKNILDLVHSQRKDLNKEVDKYCSERSV